MYDRNKNKVKIEINKALQNLSYILPPASEAKSMLEQSGKDFQFEHSDKVNRKSSTIEKPSLTLKMAGTLSSASFQRIPSLRTTGLPTPIGTTRSTERIWPCLPLFSEILRKRVTSFSQSMPSFIMAKVTAFRISMCFRLKRALTLPSM